MLQDVALNRVHPHHCEEFCMAKQAMLFITDSLRGISVSRGDCRVDTEQSVDLARARLQMCCVKAHFLISDWRDTMSRS